MVKFSIITAFYKGNKYVCDLLKIVENNTNSLKKNGVDAEVELIIVNDSPNYQIELPESYRKLNVSVVEHKENKGIHQSRVTGLLKSKGDYIVFLDQDDLLSDDALYKEYNKIGDSDAVIGNAYIEDANKYRKLLYRHNGQLKNLIKLTPYLVWRNIIASPGQCLIRRQAIPNEWFENILQSNGSDDLFLWILMFSSKRKFVVLDEPVYVHRYTGENLSSEKIKMAKSSLEVANYLVHIEYVTKTSYSRLFRRREMIISSFRPLYLIKNIDIIILKYFYMLRSRL